MTQNELHTRMKTIVLCFDSLDENIRVLLKGNKKLKDLRKTCKAGIDTAKEIVVTLRDDVIQKSTKKKTPNSYGKLISAILKWAKDRPDFDTKFVKSIKKFHDEKGILTYKQASAIDNIIRKFEIKV